VLPGTLKYPEISKNCWQITPMPKHCTTKPRQLPARPRGLALRLASWEYSSGRGRRAKPRPTPRTAS